MTENADTTTGKTQTAGAERDCLCGSLGRAFRMAAEAFGPPEEAAQHFREARKEVLLGIRELIDARIERLSRQGNKGTRIVVE